MWHGPQTKVREQSLESEHSDPAADETTGAPIIIYNMPCAFNFTQNSLLSFAHYFSYPF